MSYQQRRHDRSNAHQLRLPGSAAFNNMGKPNSYVIVLDVK